MLSKFRCLRAALAGLFIAGCSAPVREHVTMPPETNAQWRSECGSCHALFPPGMLTVGNWQAVMQHLDRHFGVDASVDDRSRHEIAAYLSRYGAANDREVHAASTLRITDTDFFVGSHAETAVSAWRRTSENRPSNCTACHKGGDDKLW